MEMFQKTCLLFTIVGAINWGLIGILDFDLVAALFGSMSMVSRTIYSVVGICGFINIGIFFHHFKEPK